jgi:hypothetical protein
VPAPGDSFVLEFGSRAGSWMALAFFAAVFGGAGYAVARALSRARADVGARWARAAGASVFAGPVVLVYVTSVAGFYDLELRQDVLRLRGLIRSTSEVPLGNVAAVRPVPFHRGTWRLEIHETSGRRHQSATSTRIDVTAAAARLQAALASDAQTR